MADEVAADAGARPRVTLAALMLGSGPRFARDAVGPVLAFYATWKLAGLAAAVLVATLAALAAFLWERRHERRGFGAAIGLGIALVQAVAGFATGSVQGYFAPAVIANGLYGAIFIGSVVVGRPLAGLFARETYPFPPQVVASATFRRVFSRISLAWGACFLLRCVLRLVALSRLSVEVFVVVSVATGLPLTAALMSWSLWYGLRGFRRSREWGWALTQH